MAPTIGHGKICFLRIPTADIARSAEFYQRIFGWNVRQREDGRTAFDDGVGQVSGEWVLDRAPAAHGGLFVYIMVESVAATVELILTQGGEIVQAVGAEAPEITAHFRDPGGNVLGIYQEPG